MVRCPGCNAQFDEPPASGICSQCGDLLLSPGAQTEAYIGPTMELPARGSEDPGATSDFTVPEDADVGEQTAPTIELPAAPDRGAGDQTAATIPLPESGSSGAGDQTAATVELPGQPKHRSVQAAPRRLSVANMELITNTWQSASDDATPRTSLKVESRSASGKGSSLVVNPRGVRSAHAGIKTSVGADYELLEVIGKGGMGVVYSARQASVDRMVAVKMIRPKVAADFERREKFLSEAVVTGDLDHPNIVPIYELGTNENDALFYSMKRVKGTPWSKVLAQKTLTENLEILLKVADAVAFAHANGVVHRDIKPENVMLGDYGEVLVMDWGLALATATFRHSEFVTGRESMGGTPAYMAPEMVTGPFELIGPPADIYLLGAILYEIVTGNVPHFGKSAQDCLLAAARNEIQPCDQDDELIEISLHAMATDPADRFAKVIDFQAAVREYQSHCESISLAARADQELAQAKDSSNYESFSHALFGYQEALAAWDGNPRARAGIGEAKLAYAGCAKAKGDFELGLSLLDPQIADHIALRSELEAALHERDARQKRLTRFRRIAAALVLLVFGVISVSLFVVAEARNRESAAKEQAILDRDAADQARRDADLARQQELEQKNKAIEAQKKAVEQEGLARDAAAKARQAEAEERKQKQIALDARNVADEQRRKAVLAKQGEEYAAYVARIGMAAAKIDENAFDTAQSLLAACVPSDGQVDLRDWEWGYLSRILRRGIDIPARGTVSSVAFAPDGKWFVTAGEDGQAHLWDRQTGKPQRAIDHGSYIHAVDISPDGRWIATAGGDGLIKLWRVEDGREVRTLTGHKDHVFDVRFSPRDGRWLVTASRDRTVRVWDAVTGSEVAEQPLQGHAWWVWSAAFSPDEKQIVSAGQDGKVIVWSANLRDDDPQFAQEKVFLGHAGPVFAAAFSPDGRQVVSGGHDKRVLVWRPDQIDNVDVKQLVTNEPTQPQASRSFEGHSGPIHTVAFAADGQSVLSGGEDNSVRIWDAMTGRLRTLLRGHSRPVRSCAFSPDDRQVLSGGLEGQVKLWDLLDDKVVGAPYGRMLEGHEDAIMSAAFSPDGSKVVTGSRDHTARVYDADSGQCVHQLKEGHEFLASRAIYFNRDRWLLTAAGDNSVRIWDAVTGTELAAMEGTGRNAAVAVSGDGQWILTGTADTFGGSGPGSQPGEPPALDELRPKIALWKLDPKGTSAQRHEPQDRRFGTGHRGLITAVAISPDGRLLFSGDDTGAGKLWNAATGAESVALRGHTRAITDAAFTPDGRRLLTASYDGTVAQWDAATGKELPQILSHVNPRNSDAYDAPVKAIAVSPDGRQVLTLSEDAQDGVLYSVVLVWDTDRARVLRELYRGPQTITSVAITSDGRAALAAGSVREVDAGGAETARSFVRRWELATGREATSAGDNPFLDFGGRQESVWAAIEAPAGAGVLTVGGNGASLWSPARRDKPELVFKPHGGVMAAGFSPDGLLIVTGSTDQRAKIWSAESGKCVLQLPPEHARSIASANFSPADKRLLVTGSSDGTARIWQIPERRVLHVIANREQDGPASPVRSAMFSPDGKQVLTAGDDGTIRLWDAQSGQLQRAIPFGAPVFSVAYSADGGRIIGGAANGRARIYDVASGRLLVRCLGHTAAVNSVAFSPDGRRALTGSNDRTAKLWDTLPPRDIPADSEQPTDAAQQTTDARIGKEILTLKHHDQAITSVAFSPDGRSILTAGLDGTAVLWLADDWQPAVAEQPRDATR